MIVDAHHGADRVRRACDALAGDQRAAAVERAQVRLRVRRRWVVDLEILKHQPAAAAGDVRGNSARCAPNVSAATVTSVAPTSTFRFAARLTDRFAPSELVIVAAAESTRPGSFGNSSVGHPTRSPVRVDLPQLIAGAADPQMIVELSRRGLRQHKTSDRHQCRCNRPRPCHDLIPLLASEMSMRRMCGHAWLISPLSNNSRSPINTTGHPRAAPRGCPDSIIGNQLVGSVTFVVYFRRRRRHRGQRADRRSARSCPAPER